VNAPAFLNMGKNTVSTDMNSFNRAGPNARIASFTFTPIKLDYVIGHILKFMFDKNNSGLKTVNIEIIKINYCLILINQKRQLMNFA
jgi:hypothetical protein